MQRFSLIGSLKDLTILAILVLKSSMTDGGNSINVRIVNSIECGGAEVIKIHARHVPVLLGWAGAGLGGKQLQSSE